MINALNAERVKLLSTRSPYWCVGVVVVLALGAAAITGSAVSGGAGTSSSEIAYMSLLGLSSFGLLVLMIMAVLAITNEYRFGTIRTTFQAIPKRWIVLLAKAGVFGGLAFIATVVLAVAALLLVRVIGGSGAGLELGDSGVMRQIWGMPIIAVLFVLIGLGVGASVRHTAGAIVIVLIWDLAVESIVAVLPRVGTHVAPFLPFRNATRFLAGDNSDMAGGGYHWGVYGSLVYFAVFAIAIFVIGIVVVERRDA
ncbi:ABC transporter permease [Gordonia sp. CPCC 205515]|uniref:ABC transporter permease n=1 Tax=Gordonia sp. CPCC 205515 TaxID=3140791 RepID=UPI003AF39309